MALRLPPSTTSAAFLPAGRRPMQSAPRLAPAALVEEPA